MATVDTNDKKIETENQSRPPVVVIMGHVDHGKTTLLDYIRKSRIAEKETGGITQHIGAYTIDTPAAITFIDTPGHEAFSKMRSRGAKVADIGVLVVAADEGVKPQTKEAIQILKSAAVPFIVAINKIDRSGKDTDRVKKELAENDVLVESWGGKIPSIEISAKTGENIDGLLELILLVAEVSELTGELDASAEGVVIESHRDARRGTTATLLVQEGTLKRGDFVVTGGAFSAVKILEDFQGNPVNSVPLSRPARVSGLSDVPLVGATFRSFADKEAAELEAEKGAGVGRNQAVPDDTKGKVHINVILKADVSGSREAIEDVLKSMQLPDVGVRLIRSEVGDVNDSDLQLALSSSNVVMVAFRVKVPSYISDEAKKKNVALIQAGIIYEIFDLMKETVRHLIPAEIREVPLGKLKVLKFFKHEKSKQIIGGRVTEGKLETAALIRVLRKGAAQGKGKIVGLQIRSQQVSEVAEGNECGLLVEADMQIAENDVLETYKEERVERSF
ncbi:MAG: translation initiation factor IF-2 [Candidatus Sungbacteria bacterium]|nr:translation initiation factor IF-2 [Candidatus Sungbacteria bacterium]